MSEGESGKSANNIKCWNSQDKAIERLDDMFVTIVQGNRIKNGIRPVRRSVFRKQHGVAYGVLAPNSDLEKSLQVGTFSHGPLNCYMRFSSDVGPKDPDLKSTMGIGIKLFDVPGVKLEGESNTADFILQNHDVFFVDTAEEMAEFTTAGVIDGNYPAYLKKHKQTAKILKEMEKIEASCLTTDYWAILPFAFGKNEDGSDRYVKYRLTPVDQYLGQPFDQNDYLGIDLANRLRAEDACFDFQIQIRTNPSTMPLDKATERWSEKKSPWVSIATLTIPRQDIDHLGQSEYGEHLAFNIWRTPPEQEPKGSIAAVRKVVYKGSADKRREANGISIVEPNGPPAIETTFSATADDDCIVSAAIYPPIGIARIGNSKDAFYIGPEVSDPPPEEVGFYRDTHGALKREAARFRIYGLNAQGCAVKELTDENADISWQVHLVNQKSAWYQFQLALDVPEAADAPPSLLRNSQAADREKLVIDGGKHRISGKNKSGKKYAFDDGAFMDKKVYLGELKTDDAGRLIVLGGRGVSASYNDTKAITFANNNGWHDDTSDGPVTAKVSYMGNQLKVDPAWIVVAPPNYGPALKSVRTMWDLMRDLAVSKNMLPCPPRPSFENDIRPIFERMTRLEWANAGFAAAFGWGGQFNLSTDEWLKKLSDPSPAYMELRKTITNNFRHNDVDSWSPVPWPWLYGDAMSVPAAHTPRQNCTLSDLQLSFLDQWVLGDFDNDYAPDLKPPKSIDDVSIADQPDMLTKAAMEFCLADAFHPGCEMTWPMRNSGLYMAPFRLLHVKKHQKEPGYGAQLNKDSLGTANSPLNGGQFPGGITRWMAVPWQTDTASCRSGYDKSYDPYLPTFWPARVPNQVMTEDSYKIVMDEKKGLEERLQAFANRADWDDPLGGADGKSYTHQINHMIHHFDKMGVVEVREGIKASADFPPQMQVSDKGRTTSEENKARMANLHKTGQYESPADADLGIIEKVQRFPDGLRHQK